MSFDISISKDAAETQEMLINAIRAAINEAAIHANNTILYIEIQFNSRKKRSADTPENVSVTAKFTMDQLVPISIVRLFLLKYLRI